MTCSVIVDGTPYMFGVGAFQAVDESYRKHIYRLNDCSLKLVGELPFRFRLIHFTEIIKRIVSAKVIVPQLETIFIFVFHIPKGKAAGEAKDRSVRLNVCQTRPTFINELESLQVLNRFSLLGLTKKADQVEISKLGSIKSGLEIVDILLAEFREQLYFILITHFMFLVVMVILMVRSTQ